MKDYYQTLGLAQDASDADIKSAYRKMAKLYHPDTNQGNASAEAKFKEIGEAYDALRDPNKRAIHDAELKQPPKKEHYWSNRPQYEGMDIDEILRDIQRSRWGNDTKNRDITLTYAITLEEAFTGKDAQIKYAIQSETKEVSIKIPAGITDGIKLRFKGYGDTIMKNVAAGDLFIKISILQNMQFTRDEYNLITKVSVGYLEALVGTEREIPTIEGGRIKMRIPAGIFPGQTLRASKKGMPKPDGLRGDMMIEVSIIPEKLDEEERRIISDLLIKRNG